MKTDLTTGRHSLFRIMKVMVSILVLSSLFVIPSALAEPRNVIFLIGDGMGFEQVKAAGLYAYGSDGTMLFESLPFSAEVRTRSADSAVTDSAAAATAIATGEKVNNGVISIDLPGSGGELYTILEYFRDRGKRTGLVTTTYISHATPAAFGAHEASRNNSAAIVSDYLYQTRPNILFGGAQFMDKASAVNAGYKVVTDSTGLWRLRTDRESMVSGQFGNTHLPYEYDYFIGSDSGYNSLPHLSEMTAVALDILDDDPEGFFLMVEAGRIDHAGHENHIERIIFETLEFNDTVQTVMDWAYLRPDTLVIVTADHETGGLHVLSSNGQGIVPTVSWSTAGHTDLNVPVYAAGENAQLVSGIMDNTDFFDVALFSSLAPVDYYCDTDADAYVSSSVSGFCQGTGCEPWGCQTAGGGDCDDSDEAIFPGAAEDCLDGVDNDCDGFTDSSDSDCSGTCQETGSLSVISEQTLSGDAVDLTPLVEEHNAVNVMYTVSSGSGCPVQDGETIIHRNDSWKYDVENTSLRWMESGYNDSGWVTGSGVFGTEPQAGDTYHPYVIATPISNTSMSMFFRTAFTVCDPLSVSALKINALFDDGMVIYINGAEVYREGVTGYPPLYNGGAAHHEATGYEEKDLTSLIGLPALRDLLEPGGSNVIAIGVYNADSLSSDIVWDGELLISQNGTAGGILFTGDSIQAQSVDTAGWTEGEKILEVTGDDAICQTALAPAAGSFLFTLSPAVETDCFDGVDNDGDGLTDEQDPDCFATCSDADGDGYTICSGDCNDFDREINPGACDIKYDGIDQDCNGRDRTHGKSCSGDGPGKVEICDDGKDNDRDGKVDCADKKDCGKNPVCQ